MYVDYDLFTVFKEAANLRGRSASLEVEGLMCQWLAEKRMLDGDTAKPKGMTPEEFE